MDKKVELFVLCLIKNKAGERIGLRVYNVVTKKVSDVAVPQQDGYLNLDVRKGRLYPKSCKLTDFPVLTAMYNSLGTYIADVIGANAWVLGRNEKGNLHLVSVSGQEKVVTDKVALNFHKTYGIVGCTVYKNTDLIIHTKNYVDVDEVKKLSTSVKSAISKKRVVGTVSAKETKTSKTAKEDKTIKVTKTAKTRESKQAVAKSASVKHLKADVETNAKDSVLDGRTFFIAGRVKYPGLRNGLQEYIMSLGGKIATTLTKDVNYVITNDVKATKAKVRTAFQLGCSIISEDYFLDLVQVGNGVRASAV